MRTIDVLRARRLMDRMPAKLPAVGEPMTVAAYAFLKESAEMLSRLLSQIEVEHPVLNGTAPEIVVPVPGVQWMQPPGNDAPITAPKRSVIPEGWIESRSTLPWKKGDRACIMHGKWDNFAQKFLGDERSGCLVTVVSPRKGRRWVRVLRDGNKPNSVEIIAVSRLRRVEPVERAA